MKHAPKMIRRSRRKPRSKAPLPTGWNNPKGYHVKGVRVRTELVRLMLDAGGSAVPQWDTSVRSRDESAVEFDGAFGFYFVDRVVLLVEGPGKKRVTAFLQGIENPGPTFFCPSCVIATVTQHIHMRGTATPLLASYQSRNPGTLLVGFEANGDWYYFQCDARDRVYDPPSAQLLN